jgi:hypothetical protein
MVDRPKATVARILAPRLTWGERTNMLEDALRRLPIKPPDDPSAIPYSFLIPDIARQLLGMPRADKRRPPLAAIDSEIAHIVSALLKLEYLSGIADEASLQNSLSSEPTERDSALPKAPAPLPLPFPLSSHFIEIAGQAGVLARDIIKTCPQRGPSRRSRPRKIASRRIAEFLYQQTERLTAKPPIRSVGWADGIEQGPFVTLVREVFQILGESDSPVEAARAAIEKENPMGLSQE